MYGQKSSLPVDLYFGTFGKIDLSAWIEQHIYTSIHIISSFITF